VNTQWDACGWLFALMQDLSRSWHGNEDFPAGTPRCAKALMVPTLVSSSPAPTLAALAAPEMHKDHAALNKPGLGVQEGGC